MLKLKPIIKRTDTQLRTPISVEHRVAMTLLCLATLCEYRTVGHLFGVARCTVSVFVHDICKAINLVFSTDFIVFPSGSELVMLCKALKKGGVSFNVLDILMAHRYQCQHPLVSTLTFTSGKDGTPSSSKL